MSDKKQALNELHLNLLGKVFLSALGSWLIGNRTNLKIRGNQKEIAALISALASSKRFQAELRKPGASIQSVMDAMNAKNMSAREFETVFGVRWPL